MKSSIKTTNKRPTFSEFKKEALQDKEVKAAYDLLEAEFAFLQKTFLETAQMDSTRLRLAHHERKKL